MVKLSKVAVWLVPPENEIALPAETIVPPPVARIDAPFPCSPTAVAAALVVLTLSVPVAVIEPGGAARRRVAGEQADTRPGPRS